MSYSLSFGENFTRRDNEGNAQLRMQHRRADFDIFGGETSAEYCLRRESRWRAKQKCLCHFRMPFNRPQLLSGPAEQGARNCYQQCFPLNCPFRWVIKRVQNLKATSLFNRLLVDFKFSSLAFFTRISFHTFRDLKHTKIYYFNLLPRCEIPPAFEFILIKSRKFSAVTNLKISQF